MVTKKFNSFQLRSKLQFWFSEDYLLGVKHKDILQSEKRMSAGMTEEEKQLFLQCLQKVYENLKDDMDETEHCHNNYHNNEGKE